MSMKSDSNFRLPAWLEAELPEVRPEARIALTEIGYIIEDCCKEIAGPYTTVEEAFDVFKKHPCSKTLTLSEECLKAHEGREGGIFLEEGHPLLSWTDENSLWLLQEDYRSWLTFYQEWKESPEDFLSAYRFIEQHPAFWTRLKHEKTFMWHTSDGMPITIIPRRDDKGQVCISLETGGHVEPAYTDHYHDYRLAVTEPTFEEAIVALAKRVDEIFDEAGCEREGVAEYPPPAYLVEALALLKRYEEGDRA